MTDEQCRATVRIAIERGFCAPPPDWPKVVESAKRMGLCVFVQEPPPPPRKVKKKYDPTPTKTERPRQTREQYLAYHKAYNRQRPNRVGGKHTIRYATREEALEAKRACKRRCKEREKEARRLKRGAE